MTGQNLHEHPEQFLTNMTICISNLRGSFRIRSLESEVTLGVSQLASNLQMLASREPQGCSSQALSDLLFSYWRPLATGF